ncbi:hypothetical protein D3C83_217600 [compost metagenome]
MKPIEPHSRIGPYAPGRPSIMEKVIASTSGDAPADKRLMASNNSAIARGSSRNGSARKPASIAKAENTMIALRAPP